MPRRSARYCGVPFVGERSGVLLPTHVMLSSVRVAVLLGWLVAACSSYGDSPAAPAPANDGGTGDAGVSICTENVLYVATTGDDANDGCDKAKPKRTLTSALGSVQARGAANAEIRTCAETFRERVVLAYPASIVGGFACGTWTPGAGRTGIEAPDDREAETLIAFGASVQPTVRLEHLRIVGPSRTTGYVSALRVKDGAAPLVKDAELVGGSTGEGVAITLGIEGKSSPTIEDSIVKGGRARCTMDCTKVVATTVAIDGGTPKLRRTRIEGSEADVPASGTYVGTVTLDVFGGAKATGSDAFSDLTIVHGIGRVAVSNAAAGMRVTGQSELELVDSTLSANATASTCVSSPCYGVGIEASNATFRVRRSRIEATPTAGAAGTTNVVLVPLGLLADLSGQLDVASSLVRAEHTAAPFASSIITVRASTLIGKTIVENQGGTISVESSLLAHVDSQAIAILASSCTNATKTTLASSFIVSAAPNVVAFADGSSMSCSATAVFATPKDAANASTSKNVFSSTNSDRTTCTGTAEACLLDVFEPGDDPKLKAGVSCAIAKGGLAFAELSTDLFGTQRTETISMGASEYDGACRN